MRSGFLTRSSATLHRLKMTTVGKPRKHKRRFLRPAKPAQRGIGPGCWPTEVGGLAGRLDVNLSLTFTYVPFSGRRPTSGV